MKSIDTYLCKEKKEVYKINTNFIYPQADRLYTMQDIQVKLLIDDESIEPDPLKWPLRVAVVALLAFTIYKGLCL